MNVTLKDKPIDYLIVLIYVRLFLQFYKYILYIHILFAMRA